MLIVCTMERFLCVSYPFVHRRFVTRGKLLIVFPITWSVTTVPAFAFIFVVRNRGGGKGRIYKDSLFTYFLTAALVLLLCIFSVFVLLAATYKSIKSSIDKRVDIQQNSSSSSRKSDMNRKQEWKVTKVFLMISIIYCVTLLPYIIGEIVLYTLHDLGERTLKICKMSSYLFYLLSSVVNPLLTLFYKADFLASLRLIFRREIDMTE